MKKNDVKIDVAMFLLYILKVIIVVEIACLLYHVYTSVITH